MLAGITCESSGQGQGCSRNMASSLLEESELGWGRHGHELTARSARCLGRGFVFYTHPYHA